MKRVLAALAVALIAIFVFAGCNDYGNTFQNNTGALITTLSPSNITAGSPQFTLTISGQGFVPQTYITWNNMKLPTTDVTDSAGDVLQVSALIPANLIATAGKALIITHNPFSGSGNNGLSNPLNFIINAASQPNPSPLLGSITPASANANGPDFALTLTGSNFLLGATPSQVTWTATYPTAPSPAPSGCTAVPAGSTTTFQCPLAVVAAPNTTQIQATVPSALLTVAAAPCSQTQQSPAVNINVINVANSAGGGGTSNPIAFTVTPPPCTNSAVSKAQSAAEETPAMSADGRYVAFTSMQGTNTAIFFRDTCTGADASCQPRTWLVSEGTDGSAANDDSHTPSMSADGRYVAFTSAATNLLPSNANGDKAPAVPGAGRQIYLRDTCMRAATTCIPSTELVSTDATGQLTGTEAILPSVSASGRFVAFLAVTMSKSPSGHATQNSNPNSGYRQVFVRDTCLGASDCTVKTLRISMQPGDGTGATGTTPATPAPAGPALSGDAKNIAVTGGGTAVFFAPSRAVDDRLFVAALHGTP